MGLAEFKVMQESAHCDDNQTEQGLPYKKLFMNC